MRRCSSPLVVVARVAETALLIAACSASPSETMRPCQTAASRGSSLLTTAGRSWRIKVLQQGPNTWGSTDSNSFRPTEARARSQSQARNLRNKYSNFTGPRSCRKRAQPPITVSAEQKAKSTPSERKSRRHERPAQKRASAAPLGILMLQSGQRKTCRPMSKCQGPTREKLK